MIDDWSETLKNVVACTFGVEQAHDFRNIPGAINVFPTAIILPKSGALSYSAGGPNVMLHQVRIAVYVSGAVLPEAYEKAIPLITEIAKEIAAHSTLSGLVKSIAPVELPGAWYEGPGEMRYGDAVLFGFVLNYQVKEFVPLTVTA